MDGQICLTAYRGSGVPTTSEPGCATGSVMTGSSGTFTVHLELNQHQMLVHHSVFLYDGDWTQVIQSQQCHILLHKRGKNSASITRTKS